MAKVYNQTKTKGVEFVGVFVHDTDADAREFIKEFGLTFPVGLDPDTKIASAYRFVGMPLTIFITRNGEIADRVTGPLDEKGLAQRVQKLLSEPLASAVTCADLAREAEGLFTKAKAKNAKEAKHWKKEIDLADKRCKEGREKQASGIFKEVMAEIQRELKKKELSTV